MTKMLYESASAARARKAQRAADRKYRSDIVAGYAGVRKRPRKKGNSYGLRKKRR